MHNMIYHLFGSCGSTLPDDEDYEVRYKDFDELDIEDFVSIKFARKKAVVYYIARVLEINGDEYKVYFLKEKQIHSILIFLSRYRSNL